MGSTNVKKLFKFGRMLEDKRPLSQLQSFLANNEVDLNSAELGAFCETALHYAVYFHSDIDVVDLLISHGANPNVYDCSRWSIMHYAVSNLASPQMVQKVLDVGITFAVTDEDGNRPIHLAAQKGNISAIEILLAAGESINICGQWNQTPLHFAAKGHSDRAKETIKYLLDKGADLWAEEENGFLPITGAHSNDELLSFFASIMPGKLKDRDSEEFITFSDFIERYGRWQLGCALVNMIPVKKTDTDNNI